jgi:hypothetical protein
MIRFSDDDPGYLSWIAEHPDGFVLNVRRPADSRCVVLHRANCASISNDTYEPNAFTGRKHHKICATSEAELKLAAKSEGRLGGTFSKRCGLCGPWTSVESPMETARRPAGAATLGEKITEPIGLISAKLGKQILRQPGVQPSVSYQRAIDLVWSPRGMAGQSFLVEPSDILNRHCCARPSISGPALFGI